MLLDHLASCYDLTAQDLLRLGDALDMLQRQQRQQQQQGQQQPQQQQQEQQQQQQQQQLPMFLRRLLANAEAAAGLCSSRRHWGGVDAEWVVAVDSLGVDARPPQGRDAAGITAQRDDEGDVGDAGQGWAGGGSGKRRRVGAMAQGPATWEGLVAYVQARAAQHPLRRSQQPAVAPAAAAPLCSTAPPGASPCAGLPEGARYESLAAVAGLHAETAGGGPPALADVRLSTEQLQRLLAAVMAAAQQQLQAAGRVQAHNAP